MPNTQEPEVRITLEVASHAMGAMQGYLNEAIRQKDERTIKILSKEIRQISKAINSASKEKNK